ncbi:PulJ/GspJ family protein [Paenibacillus tengchongensis]|uniref:PulJ/GspJ family protein n=1 Tax=Paenibacillus tengchongensis TaxID=2608684 RepID=UPI00124F5927|nr:prepilin-type N-terminal cleavage/methylation domain-containing protein [Paenibacillus tengchongensis]
MKIFAKSSEPENGFTLIELIAAVTLFAIVAGIIGSVTMFGFRSYHKITVENKLRDEADLVMSSIITELYTYGPEEIRNTASGITLRRSDSGEVQIRVEDKDLIIGDARIGPGDSATMDLDSELGGSSIAVTKVNDKVPDINVPYESGLVSIELVLSYKSGDSEDKLTVKSQFGF